MQFLRPIQLTAEQLTIANFPPLGIRVIKGAAGSGKTTVAIFRMITVAKTIRADKNRQNDESPVICRLITYNRTLKSYVEALIETERIKLGAASGIVIEVSTFDKWASDECSPDGLFYLSDKHSAGNQIVQLASKHGISNYDNDFIISEVAYILGLIPHNALDSYLNIERTGRGASPKIPLTVRQQFINVVNDYQKWKLEKNLTDGDDLSVMMQNHTTPTEHDLIVVDESQDLSANKMRAIMHFLKPNLESLTIIFDSAQRIYKHGYTWKEVGINVSGGDRSVSLTRNYRNTFEIAAYVNSVLSKADIGLDGTIPDPSKCEKSTILPTVVKGRFPKQVAYAVNIIKNNINLKTETVAFLHPKGWFKSNGGLAQQLSNAGIDFTILTGVDNWPNGDENIALLTMSSAKGLEFDHVFILGLDQETTSCVDGIDDDARNFYIRLFAVACSRARKTLTIGALNENPSFLLSLADRATYTETAV